MPSERVREFYDSQSFAIVGMSRNDKNFAWAIFDQLMTQGKTVYAVHPDNGHSDGIRFYHSLQDLPEIPEAVIVSLDLKQSSGILEDVKNSGAKRIWFQQGSYDDTVLEEASKLGLDPIKGCALMYLPGTPFIHKVHKAVNELFGKGYK